MQTTICDRFVSPDHACRRRIHANRHVGRYYSPGDGYARCNGDRVRPIHDEVLTNVVATVDRDLFLTGLSNSPRRSMPYRTTLVPRFRNIDEKSKRSDYILGVAFQAGVSREGSYRGADEWGSTDLRGHFGRGLRGLGDILHRGELLFELSVSPKAKKRYE